MDVIPTEIHAKLTALGPGAVGAGIAAFLSNESWGRRVFTFIAGVALAAYCRSALAAWSHQDDTTAWPAIAIGAFGMLGISRFYVWLRTYNFGQLVEDVLRKFFNVPPPPAKRK